MSLPLTILKGDDFADRLANIGHEPMPSDPLPNLKYQRILVPGLTGGERHFALLGFIAQALRIRGASVTALMCDAMLPACTLRKVDHAESAGTRWRHRNSPRFAGAMNLPHRWYSDSISADVMDEHLTLGADRSLDAICRGVLLDEPFENPLTRHNELTGVGAGMREQ